MRAYPLWVLPNLLKQPLVAFGALLGGSLLALFFIPLVLGVSLRVTSWVKQPAVAFIWGADGGCYGAFSSSSIRVSLHQSPPLSGGSGVHDSSVHDMKHSVEVTREPPLVPSSFDELY